MTLVNASSRRKELVRIAARLFVEEGFDRTTVRMRVRRFKLRAQAAAPTENR